MTSPARERWGSVAKHRTALGQAGGGMMKTHWLYGRGPKKQIKFNVEIEKETICQSCIHNKVCDHDMEKRCANYEFGTSQHRSCLSCIHHYTRWDKESIPCFTCPDFVQVIAPAQED